MIDTSAVNDNEMSTSTVEEVVRSDVEIAVVNAVSQPDVKADLSAAPKIIEAVIEQILPIILHSTNQEPWYRSRVFWSAMLGLIASILALFGIVFDATSQQLWLGAINATIPLVSAALALWGRYATKPLGK